MAPNKVLWLANFAQLEAFASKHGHCLVPFTSETRQLAKWTTSQRTGKLESWQKEKLTSIGFNWKSKKERQDEEWESLRRKLEQYGASHGHLRVPLTNGSDPVLGTWVANQRKLHNQGKLRADRIQILSEMGFVWWSTPGDRSKESSTSTKSPTGSIAPTDPASKMPLRRRPKQNNVKYDKKWNEMLVRLQAYKAKHGDCLVPYGYTPDPELGNWVGTQRRDYHKKTWYGSNRVIAESRQRKLDELGFLWGDLVGRNQSPAGVATLAFRKMQKRVAQEEATQSNDEEFELCSDE
jgi:hypothetical protein